MMDAPITIGMAVAFIGMCTGGFVTFIGLLAGYFYTDDRRYGAAVFSLIIALFGLYILFNSAADANRRIDIKIEAR